MKRWSRPRRLDFLDRLPTAPVADTEVLHLAHYAPLVVVATEQGPRVALLLDPSLTRGDPLDKQGRWRLPYCPMALRCLPFWPGRGARDIDVALELVAPTSEGGLLLHQETGEPSAAFAAVVTLVERLQHGMARLGEAAKILLAADLLVPLMVEEPGAAARETRLLTVSGPALRSLSPTQSAGLTADRCLPLELATAMVFSQGHLAARVKPGRRPAEAAAVAVGSLNVSLDMAEPPMGVDVSPLFSFELLHRLEAKLHAG
jgi:hypothetical protein